MSVTVLVRMKGDPERLQKLFEERHDDFLAVRNEAFAAGAIHHLFAAGEGEILVVDEWDEAESFEKFFDNPTIAGFMADAGVEGPPEVTILRTMKSPDRF